MKYRVKRHTVVQPLDPSYLLIPLTRNQNAIVDTADFEWLSQWNWFASWNPGTKSFYADRWCSGGVIRMHRVILGCKEGEIGDHWNHDTLDNRRINLRKATDTQNLQNSRKYVSNSSGFKGVTWHPRNKKWQANIRVERVLKYLGQFDSIEAAAYAYDQAAKKFFGEFAHVNGVLPTTSQSG